MTQRTDRSGITGLEPPNGTASRGGQNAHLYHSAHGGRSTRARARAASSGIQRTVMARRSGATRRRCTRGCRHPAAASAARAPSAPPAPVPPPQQAARGLRVEQHVEQRRMRRSPTISTPAAEVRLIGCHPAADCSAPTRSSTPSKSGTRTRLDLDVTPLAAAISRRVADQAEAGDVGARVHGAGRQRQRLGRSAVQRRIDRDRRARRAPAGARSNLMAVPTMPVPIGLVRISTSPGLRAGVRPDARRDRRRRSPHSRT